MTSTPATGWRVPSRRIARMLLVCPTPTLDGSVLVALDPALGEDELIYEPRLHQSVRRRVRQLDWGPRATLAAASLRWWMNRTKREWRSEWRRRRYASHAAFAARHARHGSGSCRHEWGCCDFCAHGLSMVAASRFLEVGYPRYLLTFDPVDSTMTPRALLDAAQATLTDYVALSGKPGNIGLNTALIVPSMRSSTPARNGRLHCHAILDACAPLLCLKAIGERHRVQVSGAKKRTTNLYSDHARQLAYVLEQMDERVFEHPSFRSDGRRGQCVRLWTRPTARAIERRRRARDGYHSIASIREARAEHDAQYPKRVSAANGKESARTTRSAVSPRPI